MNSFGSEFFWGDVCDKQSLESAMRDIDVVYHLAAIFDYSSPKELTFKVNVEGTRNVVEACKNYGIKKMVYCSTIGVMGPTGKTPADENRKCHPVNTNYAQSKYEAEKIVREYVEKYNLPAVILRPSAVYGPRSLMGVKMFKSLASGKFSAILGDGKNLTSFIYVDDVVNAFILAGENGKNGETYIIAGNNLTLEDFYNAISDSLGNEHPKMHIPVWFAKFFAFLLEAKCKFFGGTPPITRPAVDFITDNYAYNTNKAKQKLGFEPKISIEEGVKKTVNWCKKEGYIK